MWQREALLRRVYGEAGRFYQKATQGVMDLRNQLALRQYFDKAAGFYKKTAARSGSKKTKTEGKK